MGEGLEVNDDDDWYEASDVGPSLVYYDSTDGGTDVHSILKAFTWEACLRHAYQGVYGWCGRQSCIFQLHISQIIDT